MKYVVDTSAILAGSKYDRYEKEYFMPYWKNFDKKIQEGIIISTEQVYKEIKEKDDSMRDWADRNEVMFKIPNMDVLTLVGKLHRRFPNWYDKNKEKENWADSQVIAYAKHNDMILVTQEGWNWKAESDRKFKIPTICSKCGALCHIGEKKTQELKIMMGFNV